MLTTPHWRRRGIYKIGYWSGSVKKLRSRYITSLFDLIIVWHIETHDAKKLEKVIKLVFEGQRMLNQGNWNSEWVKCDPLAMLKFARFVLHVWGDSDPVVWHGPFLREAGHDRKEFRTEKQIFSSELTVGEPVGDQCPSESQIDPISTNGGTQVMNKNSTQVMNKNTKLKKRSFSPTRNQPHKRRSACSPTPTLFLDESKTEHSTSQILSNGSSNGVSRSQEDAHSQLNLHEQNIQDEKQLKLLLQLFSKNRYLPDGKISLFTISASETAELLQITPTEVIQMINKQENVTSEFKQGRDFIRDEKDSLASDASSSFFLTPSCLARLGMKKSALCKIIRRNFFLINQTLCDQAAVARLRDLQQTHSSTNAKK